MRLLNELIATEEPAWTDFVKPWIQEATNPVEVLPRNAQRAENALYQTQVTTRSPMGAVIYETGGILIDHGWIRILGSGSEKLNRNVMDWNKGKTYEQHGEQMPYLLMADDVLGGFFAINAGGLSKEDIGKVFYFAPDDLLWSPTELTYTEFLFFCFSGNIQQFYQHFYWTGWKKEIASLDGNTGISCFPFLCTKEGSDINKVSRKAVPIEELWALHMDLKRQFTVNN